MKEKVKRRRIQRRANLEMSMQVSIKMKMIATQLLATLILVMIKKI